jgi:hypothetical protein
MNQTSSSNFINNWSALNILSKTEYGQQGWTLVSSGLHEDASRMYRAYKDGTEASLVDSTGLYYTIVVMLV